MTSSIGLALPNTFAASVRQAAEHGYLLHNRRLTTTGSGYTLMPSVGASLRSQHRFASLEDVMLALPTLPKLQAPVSSGPSPCGEIPLPTAPRRPRTP